MPARRRQPVSFPYARRATNGEGADIHPHPPRSLPGASHGRRDILSRYSSPMTPLIFLENTSTSTPSRAVVPPMARK